jgi:hypothetical protein
MVVRFRAIGIGDNVGLRVQEQPDLGECLIPIPEDSRNPAFHAEKGGKHR